LAELEELKVYDVNKLKKISLSEDVLIFLRENLNYDKFYELVKGVKNRLFQ